MVDDPAEHHIEVRRTARYFVLASPEAEVGTDLWIVCHGYGQLARTFAESFRAIAAPSRMIVAPEGLSRFYLDPSPPGAREPPPRVGASWMTREDREREIADHVAYLDALHDSLRTRVAQDGATLTALGFSQGVATVGRWLALGRTCADRMILWSGSFPPDVDLAAVAPRLAHTEVVMVAGSRDAITPLAGAESQIRRFQEAGIRARLVVFDGGHRLDDATLRSLDSRLSAG